MKKQNAPSTQAHVVRGTLYLLLLLSAFVIRLALGQQNATDSAIDPTKNSFAVGHATNAFGGNTAGGAQHAEAYRYDSVANTWTALASMTTGPDYLFHAEYGGNGKIYVMGGQNGGTLNRIYDIATNTWSAGAPVPECVNGSRPCLLQWEGLWHRWLGVRSCIELRLCLRCGLQYVERPAGAAATDGVKHGYRRN